jgi:hypothetical protein
MNGPDAGERLGLGLLTEAFKKRRDRSTRVARNPVFGHDV